MRRARLLFSHDKKAEAIGLFARLFRNCAARRAALCRPSHPLRRRTSRRARRLRRHRRNCRIFACEKACRRHSPTAAPRRASLAPIAKTQTPLDQIKRRRTLVRRRALLQKITFAKRRPFCLSLPRPRKPSSAPQKRFAFVECQRRISPLFFRLALPNGNRYTPGLVNAALSPFCGFCKAALRDCNAPRSEGFSDDFVRG